MIHDPTDGLAHALSSLLEANGDAKWPSAESIRTRAIRRKVRRRTAGGAFLILLVLGFVLPIYLVGTTSNRPRPTSVTLRITNHVGQALEISAIRPSAPNSSRASAESQVTSGEQEFSLSLLRNLDSVGTTEATNTAIAPSSLASLLSMLELGAHGTTTSQIANVLGTSSLTSSQQGAGWQSFRTDIANSAKRTGIEFDSADSLWVQLGVVLNRDFMYSLESEFAAGVWEADFRSNPDQAVSDINSWTSAQTDGRIPQLFPPGSLTSQTALVLADALYFKAAWQHPFLVAQTSLGIFHNAVGDPTTTPFMFSDSFNVPAARTRSYQAVELPYVGGRLTALVVMPTHSSLSSFVRTLDSTSLDLMIQGLHKTPVNLSLPRFRVDAPNDLSDALQAMGLSNAFHRATANFSGISSSAAYVQQVRQRTFLSVTELGTEAAAASGVSIISSARAGEIITVNRPFLFLIRDSDTGAILFASEIESLR